MLGILLDAETEERLTRLARNAGQSEAEFARAALREYLIEAEDGALAVERLREPARTYSADEVRRELDL